MPQESSRADRVPFLASRLVAAPVPDPMVVRPRLVRQLDVDRAVTLILAPAGWGKTTLLASWARSTRPGSGPAWLSVEWGDTGERLWSYLAVALGTPAPPPGSAAAPPLSAAATASRGSRTDQVEFLAAALAERSEAVVLVVDDLHRVADPTALVGLEFLLRHAGGRLRLVVAARPGPVLPLHRWRLTGDLTEIGPDDLAFTTDEVADLLTAHGVAVPPPAVSALRHRTEGWPAALRFAALSAAGENGEPAHRVEAFSGEQPDIAAYLRDEVLGQLTAADADLLRRTVVSEPVCGDLAVALTGRADAERSLDEVAGGSGFLRPDRNRPGWYRCHPLLSDLLRAEVAADPVRLRELHRRAADWHRGNGRPADALRHALASGQWDDAVDLLVADWPDLVPWGQEHTARLPAEPPAHRIDDDPELGLALAMDRARAGDRTAATEYLRMACGGARSLPAPRRDRFLWSATALEAALARLAGDYTEVRAAAARLRRTAAGQPARPADDPRSTARDGADVRLVAGMAEALADLAEGDLVRAGKGLDGAAVLAAQAARPDAESVCRSRGALTLAWAGELSEAEGVARKTLAVAAAPADRDHAYLTLALVALHRDRPADAETNLALTQGPRFEPVVAAMAAFCQAELLRDRGDQVGGHRVVSQARQGLRELPHPHQVADLLLALEADLRADRGDLAAARELLVTAPSAAATTSGRPPSGPPGPACAVALARIALRAGDVHAAGYALPDWLAPQADDWPLPVRLDAGLLDAVLAHRAGDSRRAGRLLEQVLALADPHGYRRPFARAEPALHRLLADHLDSGTAYWPFVSDLLRAREPARVGRGDPTVRAGDPPPVLNEPLTERELTVLRYLQSILSNVEIASELSLSVNTVKTHVRNIYRKLDATRRREAVRRARELHLL